MISAASLHDLHDLFCSVFVRSPAGADSINMRQLLPLILTLFALHQYEALDDVPLIHCGENSIIRGSNIGAPNFLLVHKSNHPYVDKTDGIQAIFSSHNFATLITRPRRFGKSLMLSAMRAFFWDNYPDQIDFTRYNIFIKHREFFDEHYRKFPVLYMDFSELRTFGASSNDETFRSFTRNLYNTYSYLLDSPYLSRREKVYYDRVTTGERQGDMFYIDAIRNLAKYLQKHSQKQTNNTNSVVVLIDEYDTPIMHALIERNISQYKGLLDILKCLLQMLFKSDDSPVRRGLLMGVFDISKDISSSFNNKEVLTISNPKFSEYFGFTTAETESLVRTCGTYPPEFLTDLKNKYNGYRMGNHLMYNPWSVSQSLLSGVLDNYWVETGNYVGFVKFVRSHDVQIQLTTKSLLDRRVIVVPFTTDMLLEEIYDREEYFWSYLLQTGYLTYEAPFQHSESRGGYCTVKIPNEEVIETFERIFTYINVGASNVTLDLFLNTTFEGHKERLAEYYSHIHEFHEIPLTGTDAESPSERILDIVKYNFPRGHFHHYIILGENVTIYEIKSKKGVQLMILLSRVSLKTKNPESFKNHMLTFWDAFCKEAEKKLSQNLVDVAVLALVYSHDKVTLLIHSIVQYLPHLFH
nr:PREDICTED: uncharacterized protein LOC109037214 isoform X1 [Bemisia tabaci]